MKLHRRAWLEASRSRTLLRVRFLTPFSDKTTLCGAIIDVSPGAKKIRVHRFDETRRCFAYDDTGAPETVTIPLAKTLSVRPLYATVVSDAKPVDDTMFFDAPQDHHQQHVAALQRPHVEGRLTSVSTLNVDKAFLENVRLRETVVGAVRRDRFYPLISRAVIYDVTAKRFVKGEPEWHHEQPLETLLKQRPQASPKILTSASLEPFVRRGIMLSTEPRWFHQPCTLEVGLNKRLAALGDIRPNRPMRAYFGDITAKNLGRRAYALAPADGDALMCATKALKHPLTVVFENREGETHRRLSAIADAAVLNDMEVLVVDPDHRVSFDAHTVLDLRHDETIDAALDALFEGTEASSYDALSDNNTEALEALDRHVEQNGLLAAQQQLVAALSRRLRTRGHAMAAMRVDSVVAAQGHNQILTDLKAIFAVCNKRVSSNTMAYARFSRLGLSGYQTIRELARIDDVDKRRHAFNQRMQKKPSFHLLKKLFSVMVVDDVTALPLVRNAFDLIVGVGLRDEHYPALSFADKACVMDRARPLETHGETRLIERFAARDVSVVKHHGLFDAMMHEPGRLIDIRSDEAKGLTSKAEVDAIERLLEAMPEACVRTPFVAQRTALRSRLRKHNHRDVHTTCVKATHTPTIVSLAVHEGIDPKAYAWLKGHPKTLDTLSRQGVHVVADVRAVMHVSEGDDPVFARLSVLEQASKRTLSMGAVWRMIALVTDHPGGIRVREHVPIDAVPPGFVGSLSGTIDAVLYNVNQEPVFAVASTQSVQGYTLERQGIVWLVPDAGIDLLHAAIACVKAAL